jgi:hypothetical protein
MLCYDGYLCLNFGIGTRLAFIVYENVFDNNRNKSNQIIIEDNIPNPLITAIYNT